MSGREHLLSLFLLVLVSVIGPPLAVRLRLPSAVTLIVAGVACGPAGLALISDTPSVALLSELGFLILMFVAGMEIDFESIRGAGAKALLFPAMSVLGFVGVAAGIGIWRNLSVLELIVVSASSVGMPLAVLQETGQLQRAVGRYVLLTVSIGEFVSILAIIGYELFAEEASLPHRTYKLVKVLLLFGGSAVIIRWARAVVWWKPEPFRRLIQHHDVAELGVRSGLLVMFAFVLLAAGLGVEPILGAFIAGALMAFVLREKMILESKIAALGHGLFIPIFFIVVGVRFDPRVLDISALKSAFVLLVIVATVKTIPALLFAPRELGFRQRIAAGCLFAAPLTLIVAIATIGLRLGAIHAKEQASFVLLAIALSVGFPTLFRIVVPPAPTRG
jgi:Kef-type K+ transport system membrane component KefB